MSDSAPLMHATVTVTVEAGRHSWFRCPECDRKVTFSNAFPFSFQWKLCTKCRRVWANIGYYDGDVGPHADDAVGTTRDIEVVSNGRNTGDGPPTPTRVPMPVAGERYARCIVYVRWVPGDQLRPVESYDELAGAINRSDELAAGGRGPTDVKVIDVENLELGDMRVAEACAEMVARIRADTNTNERA